MIPDMTDPSTVLVAVGDPNSVRVGLPAGRVVARQLGATVELLHVTKSRTDEAAARAKLELKDAEVRLVLRRGNAAEEILAAAKDADVALLVMAARAPASEGPLASVTREVVARSHRPILLVRSEDGAREAPRPLRRLVLPVDGSPTTARALRAVSELAVRLDAHLDLLYVAGGETTREVGAMTAPRYVDQPHHEWPSWSEEVIDRLCRCLARCPKEVQIDMFLASGDPGEEITRFASQHDEDAVVLVRRSEMQEGRGKTLWHIFRTSPVPFTLIVGQYQRWLSVVPTASSPTTKAG